MVLALPTDLLFVLLAAVLEVGGDALIRAGRHTGAGIWQAALLLAGCCVLAFYGFAVNASGRDFGRLLGIYVAVFFVVAQIVNAIAFGQLPGTGVLVGGALIVTGGLLVAAL